MNEKILDKEEWLKPNNMIRLYSKGAFPMADEITGHINWYMPEVRAIIPLNNYNVPRSLKKIIKENIFELRYDYDFLSVVKGCADRNETWISDRLIKAYFELNKLGYVHTVETWQKGKLVGGLYGISYGGAFFGESMFSKVTQASKVALVKLLERLKEKNFVIRSEVNQYIKNLVPARDNRSACCWSSGRSPRRYRA